MEKITFSVLTGYKNDEVLYFNIQLFGPYLSLKVPFDRESHIKY